MKVGVRGLRRGDKVRVTPDRISNRGNGILGPSGELIIKNASLSEGENIPVRIIETRGQVTAISLPPTSLPLPEVVWDDSSKYPGLRIQATSAEWAEFMRHRKNAGKRRGGFISNDLKRSRKQLKESKLRKRRSPKKSVSHLAELFNLGQMTEQQTREEGPRESNERIETRNLNKLLSKRE